MPPLLRRFFLNKLASNFFISYGLVSRWSCYRLFLTYCCCCCCIGSWCCCCTLDIRDHPYPVAPWGIAAHQNAPNMSIDRLLGDPATDLGRVTPDHRCVMTVNPVRQSETRLDRGAWDIIALFLDPALG